MKDRGNPAGPDPAGRSLRRVYSVSPWGDLSGATLCALEHARWVGPHVGEGCLVLAHGERLKDRAEEAGIRTVCFEFENRGLRRAGWWRRLRSGLPVARSRWRYVRGLQNLLRQQPGILHIHSLKGASGYALLAGIWSGAPVVLTLHEFPGGSRWRSALDLFLVRHFVRAVLAVSGAAAQAYASGLAGRPVSVVSNFMELPPPSPPRTRGSVPVLALIGQISAQKGCREFFQVCQNLAARQVQFQAQVVGAWRSEADRRQGEDFIRGAGLQARIAFRGTIANLAEIYGGSDVVAVPSHEETFGRVAMEGMAYGLPVVASRVGGLPELVDDGVTGHLVPVGDVAALTDKIQVLLQDEDLRRRMGAAGRDRVRRLFSPEEYVRRMLAIYAGL